MKKIWIIIALFVFLAGGAAVYDLYASPRFTPASYQDLVSRIQPVTTKEPAPDFSFKSLDQDQEHRLSDFKGKKVILHFWATWCAPCVAEFPALMTLMQEAGDDVVLLAVSSDFSQDPLKKFLKDIKYQPSSNVFIIPDEKGEITQKLFLTQKFPETVLIDQDGQLDAKIVGPYDWQGTEIRGYLAQPRDVVPDQN